MPKKARTNRARSASRGAVSRADIPDDLKKRLHSAWRRIGHLVDWCDSPESWIKMFASEARPYRATFYWESVAEMVSDYMLDHPHAEPEEVLTDCLMATRYPASPDDGLRLTELRDMWEEVLSDSRSEIEMFIQADLELAAQEGNSSLVAQLYAADYAKWQRDEGAETD